MAVEKKWLAVPATNFTADGTSLGIVTIADTNGFKVKGYAFVAATGLPVLQLQIQRVLSPTQLIVGPLGTSPQPNNYTNISAYTVALAASIAFPEQDKNKIKPDDIEQAIYEGDPTVAARVIPVDPYGKLYGPDHPMPVAFDGTIAIGDVSIVEGGNTMTVNPDGSTNVDATIENPIEIKGPSGNIVEVSPAKAANVNLIPVSQIPFSLGTLALPSLINTLLSSLSYDSVSSDSTIGQETLTFYDSGVAVTTITMIQTADGWNLTLGAPVLDYLLLENGDYIELENGTGFILLEH